MRLIFFTIFLIEIFLILLGLMILWSRMTEEQKKGEDFRLWTKIYFFLVFLFALFTLYHIVMGEKVVLQDFNSITQQF